MITRKEYMANSRELHQAYYLQIAQMANLNARHLPESMERIREAFKTDPVLNNIPLNRWDMAAYATKHLVSRHIAKCEESAHSGLWSLGDGVCILKALARHLVESSDA